MTETAHETVVTYPRWAWALVWAGFPAVGAGIGWVLKAIAGWVSGLVWTPLRGPFTAIASIPEPLATVGALAIGALAGFAFAFMSAQESLRVTVGVDAVELQHGESAPQTYARSRVDAVFLDAKHLVLLDSGTAELAREKSDLEPDVLRRAFQEHGWPWLAADPHAAAFRRWAADDPELPQVARSLLEARAMALSKGDAAEAARLRRELANLGVVVRDEHKRQFWRTVTT